MHPLLTGASPSRGKRLRVVLVDDHALVGEALCQSLGGQSGIEVVGEAADGEEAIRLVDQVTPDLVVMDINMPRMNGI